MEPFKLLRLEKNHKIKGLNFCVESFLRQIGADNYKITQGEDLTSKLYVLENKGVIDYVYSPGNNIKIESDLTYFKNNKKIQTMAGHITFLGFEIGSEDFMYINYLADTKLANYLIKSQKHEMMNELIKY